MVPKRDDRGCYSNTTHPLLHATLSSPPSLVFLRVLFSIPRSTHTHTLTRVRSLAFSYKRKGNGECRTNHQLHPETDERTRAETNQKKALHRLIIISITLVVVIYSVFRYLDSPRHTTTANDLTVIDLCRTSTDYGSQSYFATCVSCIFDARHSRTESSEVE